MHKQNYSEEGKFEPLTLIVEEEDWTILSTVEDAMIDHKIYRASQERVGLGFDVYY